MEGPGSSFAGGQFGRGCSVPAQVDVVARRD